MPAVLVATAQGSVGNASSLSFNMTIPNLGSNGLIVVGAMGREQTGDNDPEHPQSATFNGVAMEAIENTGSNQTAGAMFAIRGTNIPVAGTYTITINYSGNNTAEFHHGVAAAWRRVRNQAAQAHTNNTTNQGGRKQVSLTTVTNNALVVAIHWWRVGFAETQYSDFSAIVIDRQDNGGGVSLYAKTKLLIGLETFDIDGGNTEDQGLLISTWETMKPVLPASFF